MSNPTELEKTEHGVRDLEYRYNGVRDAVTGINREMALLTLKEIALKENIINLKKNSLIVLVAEYKRSKDELTKTNNRMAIITKEKIDLEKAMRQILRVLNKEKEKLANLQAAIESNVLYGDFGVKNAK